MSQNSKETARIEVFAEGVEVDPQLEERLEKALLVIAKQEGQELQALNIILLTDEALLQYNQKYLDHEDYTDVITFDLSKKEGELEGEIYVSAERTRDNAKKFKEPEQKELVRVIIHGTLHLLGYKDKTPDQTREMREKENYYLNEFGFTWNRSND